MYTRFIRIIMKIKGIEQVIVELSNDNGVINSFGSPLFNPHKLSGYQIGKESNYLQFSKILPHLSILELQDILNILGSIVFSRITTS